MARRNQRMGGAEWAARAVQEKYRSLTHAQKQAVQRVRRLARDPRNARLVAHIAGTGASPAALYAVAVCTQRGWRHLADH